MATALATPAPATRTLNALDRCDRCGAQAYIAVDIHSSELLFCGHHGRVHLDALVLQGGKVTVDNTHTLSGEDRLKGDSY